MITLPLIKPASWTKELLENPFFVVILISGAVISGATFCRSANSEDATETVQPTELNKPDIKSTEAPSSAKSNASIKGSAPTFMLPMPNIDMFKVWRLEKCDDQILQFDINEQSGIKLNAFTCIDMR